MADMEHLTTVYREILALYREGKDSYVKQTHHGMTADDLEKLDQQLVCEFLAKLEDFVPDFTAAKNYKRDIIDKEQL